MEILNLIKMKKIILFVFITSFLIACEADNKKNNSEKNDPMSGYMVGNDEKSNAMIQFTKAYQENNISNTKSIFADDVVFNVNDAKMTFDEVNEGFSLGHTYFDNIKHSLFQLPNYIFHPLHAALVHDSILSQLY
jgi:hypothetical protein